MPYLIQKDSDGATIQSWSLRAGATTVGRSDDCNAKVDDQEMSRQHFTIEEHEGKFVLKDLGSKNGTRVNGVTVTEQVLKREDEIRAGVTRFVIQDSLATLWMKSIKDRGWSPDLNK